MNNGPWFTSKNIFGNDDVFDTSGKLVATVDHDGLFGDVILNDSGETIGTINDDPFFSDSKIIDFDFEI